MPITTLATGCYTNISTEHSGERWQYRKTSLKRYGMYGCLVCYCYLHVMQSNMFCFRVVQLSISVSDDKFAVFPGIGTIILKMYC